VTPRGGLHKHRLCMATRGADSQLDRPSICRAQTAQSWMFLTQRAKKHGPIAVPSVVLCSCCRQADSLIPFRTTEQIAIAQHNDRAEREREREYIP
jgi:hypothetical protein